MRIAELSWFKFPNNLYSAQTQRIVFNVQYKTKESKKLFFPNELKHEAAVESAIFSPNGTQMVTASNDGTAKLWDDGTGNRVADLFGHENTVTCAVFSPDGTQIVTASADGSAKVWFTPKGIINCLASRKASMMLKKMDLESLSIDLKD